MINVLKMIENADNIKPKLKPKLGSDIFRSAKKQNNEIQKKIITKK